MGVVPVIINADDLGMTPEINAAVFDLMARGRISSATVMPNGAALEAAIGQIADYPACSFGVHLNLTNFEPVSSDPSALAPLLGPDGCFASNVRQLKLTPALREAVFQEWRAQIEKLIDLGLRPSHIDSHHHVHTIPALFGALKRIQGYFKIRRVRITKTLYWGQEPRTLMLPVLKTAWNFALRHWYATSTTSQFTSLDEFHGLVSSGRPAPRGVIELMVHPGSSFFEDETRLLEQPWGDRLGIQLQMLSYNAI
jgi:predicted glycoside hydrolase/deacetylase ChbG (UPF0249 family)